MSFRTLANYFAWTLLKKLSPALPDVYFNAYHKIDTTSSIRTKGQERWRACLKDTEANMPLTSSLMFVKKTVTDRKRNKVFTYISMSGHVPVIAQNTRTVG